MSSYFQKLISRSQDVQQESKLIPQKRHPWARNPESIGNRIEGIDLHGNKDVSDERWSESPEPGVSSPNPFNPVNTSEPRLGKAKVPRVTKHILIRDAHRQDTSKIKPPEKLSALDRMKPVEFGDNPLEVQNESYTNPPIPAEKITHPLGTQGAEQKEKASNEPTRIKKRIEPLDARTPNNTKNLWLRAKSKPGKSIPPKNNAPERDQDRSSTTLLPEPSRIFQTRITREHTQKSSENLRKQEVKPAKQDIPSRVHPFKEKNRLVIGRINVEVVSSSPQKQIQQHEKRQVSKRSSNMTHTRNAGSKLRFGLGQM